LLTDNLEQLAIGAEYPAGEGAIETPSCINRDWYDQRRATAATIAEP
jgi:hypothetical protein